MTPAAPDRYIALDGIRGIAVLGILLLNIFSFANPHAGYINPLAFGGDRPVDIAAWGLGFVLFEGKMRALFSLLFGASMLLVIDRARAAGASGAEVHFRRMGWLLVFGLAHHLFVWEGDILGQYAIVGSLAFVFTSRSDRSLRLWAIGLLAASVLMHATTMAGVYGLKASASAPGASEGVRRAYAAVEASFAQPGSADVRSDLARHRGDYPSIATARAADAPGSIRGVLSVYGLETLGLMLAGMLLLRNGFLTGGWSDARYRRWAVRAYLAGIPPLAALAWWNRATGFAPLPTFSTFLAWAEPFRYAVTLGHAAAAMLLLRRFAGTELVARIAAAGRMAFTNYILTSLVMTSLFYGYGGALYGVLGRTELYLFVLAMWLAILAWSEPWLLRFRYGPFEWAWRSLTRGAAQPMRV